MRLCSLKSTKNGCKEKQQEPFKISGAESNLVPFYILTYEDDWNIAIIDTEKYFRENTFRIKEADHVVGRENELAELQRELRSWKRKTAVLVYGKRRVGESTLINKAADSFEGVVINHLCVISTFEWNMALLYQSICTSLSLTL